MNPALLLHFVRQDLVHRYAGSALGAVWTLLLPLANILIFTLVFSRIMGARLDTLGLASLGQYSYSVYLVVGLLAWNCFSGTLLRTTQVYREKAGLIGKVRISLASLPLYVMVSELVVYLISMGFFIIFLLAIGFEWHFTWLWWPLILFVQQLLAYALGLICAILSVFLRDLQELLSVLVQFWFWLTPIVYLLPILPERWASILQLNPLYHTTTALRDAMIAGTTPSLGGLFFIAVLASGLLALGLAMGRRMERDMRDLL